MALFARVLLKQIEETAVSSTSDAPKCSLLPSFMGKCIDTDEALRIAWNMFLRENTPLSRFCASPSTALALGAFQSLLEFLEHAPKLYLIHFSCKEELEKCEQTLRKAIRKLRRHNAPGNSSGSSLCSTQEPLPTEVIDLTSDANEGQGGRKRARQDLNTEAEDDAHDDEEQPSRTSNPLPNQVGNNDADEEEEMVQGHASDKEHDHGVPQSQQEVTLGSQHSMHSMGPQQQVLGPTVSAGISQSQRGPRSQPSNKRKQTQPSRRRDTQAATDSAAGMPEEAEEELGLWESNVVVTGYSKDGHQPKRRSSRLGESNGMATPSRQAPPLQGSPAAPKRVPALHRSAAQFPAVPQPPLW